MDHQKLPRRVDTAQGEMSGYKLAEELPPKEDVDLQKYQAPKREKRSDEPKVYTMSHAFQVFKAYVPGSRKIREILLAKARVGATFAVPGGIKYLVLFKRERYRFFSRHFPKVPEKGHGIIANMKLVHWAAMEGMKIASIFPDGTCYWIDAMDFWNYYEKYGTELQSLPGEIATPFSMWIRKF